MSVLLLSQRLRLLSAALVVLTALLVLPPITNADTCTTSYPSNAAPPAGFGTSWNVFSRAKELLLSATCSGSNLTVSAGSTTGTLYVYKTGFRWTGSTWQSYAFTGGKSNGDWFQGTAQATIPKLAGTTLFASYICQSQSNTWKCGCSDSTCATPKWQLQGVEAAVTTDGEYYVAPPAGCLNITSYGAVSGGQDNTTAFTNTITAAKKTTAKCIYVPAGNFYHNNLIDLAGISLYGADPTTSLLTASNSDRAAIESNASSGSTIANLTISATHELEFNGLPQRDLVFLDHSTNFLVQNNRFVGTAGSGAVKMFESNNGKVIGNYIDNMRAASIYMAGSAAAHHIEVAYNTVRRSRDDNVCVETYGADSTSIANNINIHHNDFADNTEGGRGVAIVGGEHITIADNVSKNSFGAGIMVATEEAWPTPGSYDITITRNTVENAGRRNGHPGILIYTGIPGTLIDTVSLTNNVTTNNVNGNYRQEENVTNVTISGNTGF